MDVTQPALPTNPSSWPLYLAPLGILFRRLGLPPNAASLPGLPSRTTSGPLTASRNAGGHTNPLVSCVGVALKLHVISFLSAASPREPTLPWLHGSLSRILSVALDRVDLRCWTTCTPSPKPPTSSLKCLQFATMLIAWEIWKERNERVFNNKSSMPSDLMRRIKEEGKDWILAGAKHLADIASSFVLGSPVCSF